MDVGAKQDRLKIGILLSDSGDELDFDRISSNALSIENLHSTGPRKRAKIKKSKVNFISA